MKKKSIEKFDFWCAFSIGVFAILTICYKYEILLKYSALLNFIFTCLPFLYLIVTNKIKQQKKYALMFVLIVGFKLISIIFNSRYLGFGDTLMNIYYFVAFVIVFIGIFFVLIPQIKEMEEKKDIFKYTSITFIIVTLIFCFYNILNNEISLNILLNANSSYDFAFSSFFNNRNNFGKMLFAANIFLVFAKQKKYIKPTIFYTLFIFINLNLILSFSRTALLCTLIFYIFYYASNKKNIFRSIIILSIVFCFVFNNKDISYILENLVLRKKVGFTGRNEIWGKAFEMIMDRFLFGYTNAMSSTEIFLRTGNYYFHNTFLKLFCCDGIVVGIIILMMLFDNLISILKIKPNNNINRKKEKYFLLGMFFSLMLYNFSEEYIFLGTGFINFWYLLFLFVLIPVITIPNLKKGKN